MDDQLVLGDLLLLAEEVRQVPYRELEREVNVAIAEAALGAPFPGPGELELFPDPVDRAAICCSWIVRLRPFRRGNPEIGYWCMREMLVRSGCPWPEPEESAEEIAEKLKDLGAGETSEAEFVRWVRERVKA